MAFVQAMKQVYGRYKNDTPLQSMRRIRSGVICKKEVRCQILLLKN